MALERVVGGVVAELEQFLDAADLTLSGLDSPSVQLWVQRDETGSIAGSTGFELSSDGAHVLIRSVAVRPDFRAAGFGSSLARHALAEAADMGATRAWLFSRRSGSFWQSLGFVSADREELASALAETEQVKLFRSTGQLLNEVAWTRRLTV